MSVTNIKNPATKTTSPNKKTKVKTLTPKQLHYCRCRANGMNMTNSYREAYSTSKMANKTVNEAASRLDSEYMVTARIDHLIGQKEAALIRSSVSLRSKVLEKLEDFMDNADKEDGNKIRAAELLGKSIGLFKEVIEDNREKLPESPEQLTATLEAKLQELQSKVSNG